MHDNTSQLLKMLDVLVSMSWCLNGFALFYRRLQTCGGAWLLGHDTFDSQNNLKFLAFGLCVLDLLQHDKRGIDGKDKDINGKPRAHIPAMSEDWSELSSV